MPTEDMPKQVPTISPDGYPLVGDGSWCEVKSHADTLSTSGRAALFLDRDGVLVEEVIYLHKPQEVALIPGAAEVVAAANAAGVPVVVVTNQSGVGRGYYTWSDFQVTQARIEEELAGHGARLDMVLACPYTPSGDGPYRHPNHPDRKPNPGMLLRAESCLALDLSRSWIVGDRGLDVQAGRRAGLAGALHVTTGFGEISEEREAALLEARRDYSVLTGQSVAAALAIVERLRA